MGLWQCDAKFNCAFSMQIQRQKPSYATPDASVGNQASPTRAWCGGPGRPRASLSGEMASRNAGEVGRAGAAIWHVEKLVFHLASGAFIPTSFHQS